MGTSWDCMRLLWRNLPLLRKKEATLTLMKHVLAGHTVIRVAENMGSTVVDWNSDGTKRKPMKRSKPFVKSLSGMRGKTELLLAEFGHRTKAEIEAIVKSCLIKWTSALQSQTANDVETMFDEILQASCLNSLKSGILKPAEQVLGKVVPWGRDLQSSRLRWKASSRPSLLLI